MTFRTLLLTVSLLALGGCKNDCESRCSQAFDDAMKGCKQNVAASASAMAGMPGVQSAAKGMSEQCEVQAKAMKSSCAGACAR